MSKALQLEANAVWKQRFRTPTVLWTTIAATNPARGLAASNQSGLYQLYGWDVPSGDLHQITDHPEGKLGGTISPDGKYIYYLNDTTGNELGHYVRLPFEGGDLQDITPNIAPYASFNLTFSHDNQLGAFTLADPEGFHVHLFDPNTNDFSDNPRKLTSIKGLALDLTFSYDGKMAAVSSDEKHGQMHFSLLVFDTTTGEQTAELSDGPESSVQPVAFSPISDDHRLLATTDASGAKRPLIWNVASGERFDLPLGDLEGEVEPVNWSPNGKKILLVHYSKAKQQLYMYDVEAQSLNRLDHPNGTFTFWGDAGTYFGSDNEIFAQWQNSTSPSRLIALDTTSGEQVRTILQAGDAPASRPWKSVVFASTDGQEIQGWLAVPEGDGPFPTIFETHGGPTSATIESFSPESQVWLDHGYAFFSLNYRGSTTFGRDYQQKIVGNLGYWEVEDMVASRDWLIDNGIADPDAILLTGWSYGGYLTLQALGVKPDLWAGGMAGIAISDWKLNYEESADTLRGYQQSLFGGTPEEKPEAYAKSSPVTYAEQVQAPVLIIQGANDTRTPARPIVEYEKIMKDLGKSILVRWFEAGHQGSFADVELGINHHEIMLRFAKDVLDDNIK